MEGGAIGVGLEDGGGWLETTSIAQDARRGGGIVREDSRVLEPSISPSEDFMDGASDTVGLGVKGRLPLHAAGGSEAVADVLLPHWSGGIAVCTAVAAGLPGMGD